MNAQYLLDNHYIKNKVTDPNTGLNIDLNSVVITITYVNGDYTYSINNSWKLEDGSTIIVDN